MSVNYEAIIKSRIEDVLYDLSYASYNRQYSSSSYTVEIEDAKTRLRELAEIANLAELKVNETYRGYNGYEIDLTYIGFEYINHDD